ncbi:MAG: MFS transporter, partial [Proteobacteria bacterium]|nr:MFS transporter [Candidatus Avisuccinivibrio stercorigallinarum]
AEDKAAAYASYDAARDALVVIASPDNYSGSQVAFDANATAAEVSAAAQEVKHIASGDLGAVSTLVLVCMIAFIASHAIGSGTIIWVFISEIFPTDQRSAGQALGASTHWVFAAALTLVFPIAIATFDTGVIFGFFCFMMILQLIWAKFMMPETKGKTLEELGRELAHD